MVARHSRRPQRTAGGAGVCLLLALIACLAGTRGAGTAPSAQPQAAGLEPVTSITCDWRDARRDRPVPVRLYGPATGRGPFPVIVFSHGLGGTRDGYAYLGRHWAAQGYVVVHVQHVGSDDSVWRDTPDRARAMRRAAASLAHAVNRPLDIRFVLDRLALLNAEAGPWRGRLDLERVGVGGHSFGAYTALAVGGQRLGRGKTSGSGRTLTDPRVKALVAMSPPVTGRARADPAWAFGGIRLPCLHLTGTRDVSPIGDTTALERRVPYDHMHLAEQYLITFVDGDHMLFAGGRSGGGIPADSAARHQLICDCTTAFWDAYLKGAPQARVWLTGGACTARLGAAATFEMKALRRTPAPAAGPGHRSPPPGTGTREEGKP